MRNGIAGAAMVILALASRAPLLAQTQAPTILDLSRLPPISAEGRVVYAEKFLTGNLPRAFAIGSNGAFGAEWGSRTLEGQRNAALDRCAQKGGVNCAIYPENLDVVWPGRPAETRPAPGGALLAGQGYEFVPDARFFWHGAPAAHGSVPDNVAYRQVPELKQVLNNAKSTATRVAFVQFKADP